MAIRYPFTQKTLIDWAGPVVFRDGEALVRRGLVQEAGYEPPWVSGTVLWSNRPLKCLVRVRPDGSAESHCPCRDNQERGIICAHVVALCLELLRRARNPGADAARQAEARRAARLANTRETDYVQRAKPGTPGAVPAEVVLTLKSDWRMAVMAGRRIPCECALALQGRRVCPPELPAGTVVALTEHDEAVLFVVEDICGGPAAGTFEASYADFVSLLDLFRGRALAEDGGVQLTVNCTPLPSYLRMKLNPETGELALMVHTEVPFAAPEESPLYLVSGHRGWVFGGGGFWPLERVLPELLQSVYREPVIIRRSAIPRFVQTEMPVLARFIRIETDVTPGLFTIEPGTPRFRLAVRGSPASLAATLHAEYNGIRLIAGKPDPAGHFAIPDPEDILRYAVRNLEAERQALRELARHGFKGEMGDQLEPIVGCREVLNFLARDLPSLRRKGWRVDIEGRVAGYAETLSHATPLVRVTPSGGGADWFEIGFAFEDATGESLSEADIQRAILKGEAFVTRGERTVLLDTEAIEALRDVFEDCASGPGSRPGAFRLPAVYAAYIRSSLNALDGVDVEAPPSWRITAETQGRLRPLERPALPETLDRVLRPYQKDGVAWLRFLEANGFCGILADEMGLGKTAQTLAWLSLERHRPESRGRPALIVCPTSLVENWAEETERFTPQLRVRLVSGPARHQHWERLTDADLVITSYALLRRDLEHYLPHRFSVVVLDEAQHIKNRSTQNAMAAKQLQGDHRLVLTGTPIENSVSDLWSIMDFLMPGYLGSHETFRRRYEIPIAQSQDEGPAAQARLRRKLQPFLLRRLKLEVATDLPPRIERVAACSLSADQQLVYRQLVDSARTRLADLVARQGFERCRMEALKTLLRLRQVCCHLGLLRWPGLRSEAPSAKMELFFELIDEALDSGHRVLVFSQFVSMLTLLREEMNRRNLAHCYLDGATKDRLAVVHEFNNNRAIPLFLISLKAGGTGLNLTGADMVIHYDPWWNPAVEDQATDRAHRIGQKRAVYSVKLITKGTVEEKVLALQRKKQAVIDATLAAGGDAMARRLSWEDVQELLTL